jgi:hypothetical protein
MIRWTVLYVEGGRLRSALCFGVVAEDPNVEEDGGWLWKYFDKHDVHASFLLYFEVYKIVKALLLFFISESAQVH